MPVSYDLITNFPGWARASDLFQSIIVQHGCKRILEIGAGANPTLSSEFVRSKGLLYVISDSSAEELGKTETDAQKLVIDFAAKAIDPALSGTFDCVMSRMVSEHISDGARYHRNIHDILRPGGISAHCLSTLWNLPLAANRLLPERLGSVLLRIFQPRDEHHFGKFKAYYSWSRGPTPSMLRSFKHLGFDVIEYVGYFGHNYYQRIGWLHQFELQKAKLLLRHPIPELCSYAKLVLRKRR